MPTHTQCIKELQVFADFALYEAKGSETSIAIYEPVMSEQYNRQRMLIGKLPIAIEENEFSLVYQPQVDLTSGDVTGVEALLRWSYIDKQTRAVQHVSPVEFVPILESTGQINQVSRWVLNEACTQARKWMELGFECGMSVNVSPVQFRSPTFVREILDVLQTTELPPHLLDLEITEGVMVDRLGETREKLQQLKDAGVSISIDDFGTGYSSLAYLKHLAIDRLKIDRIFVKDIPNCDDGSIASSIVALAHSLGLAVLAEGVETDEQLRFLQQADCGSFQGYLFSKPVPAEECTKLLLEKLRTSAEEPVLT